MREFRQVSTRVRMSKSKNQFGKADPGKVFRSTADYMDGSVCRRARLEGSLSVNEVSTFHEAPSSVGLPLPPLVPYHMLLEMVPEASILQTHWHPIRC